jgi:bacterial leucyl aminopeptidase
LLKQIVRIAPNTSHPLSPITVIGAHQDSINHVNPYLRAPGADDDGSGTITILEAYRALLKSGYAPQNPLEFQWYAAEEVH